MTIEQRSVYNVTAAERSWISDPGDGSGDRWAWQGGSELEVALTGIYRSKPDGYGWETVTPGGYGDLYGVADIAVGDTAYVLLVVYRTGGTFGYHGEWTVPGVFATREEAEEAKRRACDDNDTERAYRPWDGYFESLTSASIFELTVRP